MPLAINLKPRERLIVNGVVIENSGPVAKILIHNNAALLREKDIITEEQASSPARRLYFVIQCRYLFPARTEELVPEIATALDGLDAAMPEAAVLVAEIRGLVDGDQLYRALKSAKQLIAREGELSGLPTVLLPEAGRA